MSSILLSQLRKLINDERYHHTAFRLRCDAGDATAATVEVTTNNFLVTTVTGGATTPLSLDLTSSSYNRLHKLIYAINQVDGYDAVIDIDASETHLTADIHKILPTDIYDEACDLGTRLFPDEELIEILEDAVNRHNAAYTLNSIPDTERYHVLRLARIEVLRVQAHDAIKRRGLDIEVEDLRKLANDLERAYLQDLQRERDFGGGSTGDVSGEDISVAYMQRMSLRTGEMVPGAHNAYPSIPVLNAIINEGSGELYLTWDRNRDLDFECYKLYRHTTPDVSKDYDPSTEVFSKTDQRVVSYTDTVTASGTYYYKLYVKDLRDEYSASLISWITVVV